MTPMPAPIITATSNLYQSYKNNVRIISVTFQLHLEQLSSIDAYLISSSERPLQPDLGYNFLIVLAVFSVVVVVNAAQCTKLFSLSHFNLKTNNVAAPCLAVVFDVVDRGVEVVPEPPGPWPSRLDVDRQEILVGSAGYRQAMVF